MFKIGDKVVRKYSTDDDAWEDSVKGRSPVTIKDIDGSYISIVEDICHGDGEAVWAMRNFTLANSNIDILRRKLCSKRATK